ncbi:DUF4177 domain-containing protein [Gemmobacter denitrificans]|uniref:DUF4177 domain-containing protein n=1 Tax=Gemmobacter denitrificans TaxID=3123040 RepID=A0ABU8BS61_9RHOB
MQQFEFKVVPAPRRAEKVRGLKTTEDRFAHALMQVMNQLGREGWDYVRADVLPCEERVGLTGKATNFHNMLVFRRPLATAAAATVVAMTEIAPPAPTEAPRLGTALVSEGSAPALGPARPEAANG